MEWLTTLLRQLARPLQWWVTLGPWERGIRIRLGKTAKTLTPGIHLRIPFLDRVYVQSVRLRTIYDSMHTVTSADGHAATIGIAIDFEIEDIQKMFNSLSSPDATLRFRAAAAVAAYVAHHNKEDITPYDVAMAVSESLRDFGCGIGNIRANVIAFAFARTLRLMMNDYSNGSGLHNDFDQESERR